MRRSGAMGLHGAGSAMAERCWRILATGTCFVTFGLGGLVLGLLMWPALLACVRGEQARTRAVRRMIRRAFGVFVRMMRALGVITLEVRGAERLARRGQLILPNHPSLIDVVILLSLVEDGNCIVKSALLRNPFTRGAVRAARYIANDEGPAVLDSCVSALLGGDNLVMFPEGTRSVPGGVLRLYRGAAHIAVRSACPVTPVIIRVSTPTLYKGSRWFQVPRERPHFTVEVKGDIDMALYRVPGKSYSVLARRLTERLHDYYLQETREVDAR
jgi:1-acyl-sn-glycerol-3-phosphate acyltransferase